MVRISELKDLKGKVRESKWTPLGVGETKVIEVLYKDKVVSMYWDKSGVSSYYFVADITGDAILSDEYSSMGVMLTEMSKVMKAW